MADVKAKVKTPKKKASKREKKDWIAAYILIAPVTLGLLVFYIWPFIQNVWFSFNDVNKFNMSTFVGLANYKEMIGDKEVWRTFGNTLKYVIVTVPVERGVLNPNHQKSRAHRLKMAALRYCQSYLYSLLAYRPQCCNK